MATLSQVGINAYGTGILHPKSKDPKLVPQVKVFILEETNSHTEIYIEVTQIFTSNYDSDYENSSEDF